MTGDWNRALEGMEARMREQGINGLGRGPIVTVYDECVHELVDKHDPRVRNARAREYLRRHKRARRQRIALALAPVAAFVVMFWRA